MVLVSKAEGPAFDRAAGFYLASGYQAAIQPLDTILAAHDSGVVVGVVRLCREGGTLVLRGMRVTPSHQRRGVGTQLLLVAIKHLGTDACFCIPYNHLQEFYERGGFRKLEPGQAPAFLQERLLDYRTRGLDVIIMHRTSGGLTSA
jgi:GNAT superfamily N-acetyltransferase